MVCVSFELLQRVVFVFLERILSFYMVCVAYFIKCNIRLIETFANTYSIIELTLYNEGQDVNNCFSAPR